MSDNMRDFLVFPVRADANTIGSQNTQKGVCPQCGTQLVAGYAFCSKCGAPVQSAPQSYQQPQMQSQPQLRVNAPTSQQSYQQPYQQPYQQQHQQPQMSSPSANVQPGPQPYQQPRMAKPLGQSIPQSSYQQPGVSGKNNSALGTLLLVIGVILFIVWLVIKTTQLLNWYEGWIPFIWAEYFKDGWLTFVSFVSPFLLWGAGLLALSGLGSVLQNKK